MSAMDGTERAGDKCLIGAYTSLSENADSRVDTGLPLLFQYRGSRDAGQVVLASCSFEWQLSRWSRVSGASCGQW
jgi:hypothetical protein